MLFDFDRSYNISGAEPAQALDHVAYLLKDYLVAGTKCIFGQQHSKWFWQLLLPHEEVRVPSEVTVLTRTSPVTRPAAAAGQSKWFVLQHRTPMKGPNAFNRPIKCVGDLPLESLFTQATSDFTVHIELPQAQQEPMPGFKDSAQKILIRTNNKEVGERLGQWFDAQVFLRDVRDGADTTCYAGFSELQYIFRVPMYYDSLLPQLLDVPQDVIAYIQSHSDILLRNCLIAGLPGSGKTTTLKKLLSGVIKNPTVESLLLADVKAEYEGWCRQNGVRFLAPGRNPACIRELQINPFIPSKNLRLTSHIDCLATLLAIGSAGGGGVLLPAYMKLLLEEWYVSFLWQHIQKADWPNDFRERKLRLLNLTGSELTARLGGDLACFRSAQYGFVDFWKTNSDVFIRRVFGIGGQSSNGRAEVIDVIACRISFFETSVFQFFCYDENGGSIDRLLTEKLCLSLAGFSKPTLQLLMSVFANLCFEALLSGQEQTCLKHLVVLEEAHLLAGQAAETNEILTVDKQVAQTVERGLCELRSKGVGLILTDQQPGTRLMSSVLANTNLKIAHNLLSKDGQMMAEAMGLPPETDFSCMGVGEGYVKVADNMPSFRCRIRI